MDDPRRAARTIASGAIVLGLVVLAGVAQSFLHRPASREVVPPAPGSQRPPEPDRDAAAGDASGQWAERLARAGWRQGSAERVVGLNRGWFEVLRKEDPSALEDQLRCLGRLGNRPGAQAFLGRFPECAGLLASADDPDELARVLDVDGERQVLLLSLFARHLGRRDVSALAAALRVNADLICRLLRRGLLGAEVLFVFRRAGPGAAEYERWLRENLAARLAGDDDGLASFVQVALRQGPGLLERLDRDGEFRTRFRGEFWPRLLRAAAAQGQALEPYLDDPHLWDVLAVRRGEELLARRGLLASPLLFGPEAYDSSEHERVISALLGGDGVTFVALTEGRFRKDPLFLRLIHRPLPGPTLAAALNKLLARGADYRPLLEKYQRLSDGSLAEEVGPAPDGPETWLPFYNHYLITRKLAQGRDPTTEEWVELGVDTATDLATLFYPPAKVAGKAATVAVEKGAGKVVTQSVRKAAVETAAKRIGRQGAEQLAAKGMERQAARWAVTGVLVEMQGAFRKAAAKATIVEITGPVRLFYKSGNVGRESFKRLTGLEARLFMRADGRVYVHVDRLACVAAREYLDQCVDSVKDHATDAAGDALEGWRKNLSAWWLLNSGDPDHSPN